jgi:flagellar biosynthesis protein FlhG
MSVAATIAHTTTTVPPPQRPAMKIAVTSGKGGVGKTSLTINLAVALARLGHRVGVVDADFALGNVDVMLGLAPDAHLGAVLCGECSVEDVTIEGPHGVRIVPAGSGVRALTQLDTHEWFRLAEALQIASRGLDFLLVDTASGVSDNVIDLVGLVDYAIVVTALEPAAVVDAYAVIKLVSASHRTKGLGIVVNAVADADAADLVFRQLAMAADKFLGRALRYDGFVVHDDDLQMAVRGQALVADRDDARGASRCFRRLARRIAASRPAWVAAPAPVPGPRLAVSLDVSSAGAPAPRLARPRRGS